MKDDWGTGIKMLFTICRMKEDWVNFNFLRGINLCVVGIGGRIE